MDTERALATIRKVDDIQPILDADRIEEVTIGGWKVVSQKGLYNVGDLVIYCEVDSFIPNTIAPFLTQEGHFPKNYNGVEGERLKSKKLRGVISQGLLLPLDILGENEPYDICDDDGEIISTVTCWKEGDNVTDLLGIQKWEAPISANLAGVARGNFPSFIHKTDEERVQNVSKYYSRLQKNLYVATEKLDGTSCTIYYRDGEFGVCSRNLNLKETDGNKLWELARRYEIEFKLKQATDNYINLCELGLLDVFSAKFNQIAIQGEVIGEGIQKNRYGLKGHDLYVFNGFDIEKQQYLNHAQLTYVCGHLGLKMVPLIDAWLSIADMTIADLILFADGKSALNPKTAREGVVFKTWRREESFKAISNSYLLRNE